MKMPQRVQLKKEILRYAGLMLGTAVLSFGLYNVHSQSDITEGGVLGLQLLIQHWFGISPSVIGPVLDLICYLIGWKILGGSFLKNAMVSTLSYGFFYSIHERMGYLLPDLGGKSDPCRRGGRSFRGNRSGTCSKSRRSHRRRRRAGADSQ